MSALPIVQSFSRRGVCPALSEPMQTGDGLLSRVAFTGNLSPDDLRNLCDLARRHGNGLVDVTARGSFQFRGLSEQTALALERDVLALDLPLRQGLAVEISPLARVDTQEIADPTSIAEQLSTRASDLRLHEKLAAKMSVIVDGDGLVPMGDLLADIRLKAVASDEGIFWRLMLGGTEDKSLLAGVLQPAHAVDCVIDLLSCLAGRGKDARGRDLDLETVRQICGVRLLMNVGSDREDSTNLSSLWERRLEGNRGSSGYAHQRLWRVNGTLSAAAIAPAFGQVSSDALAALCEKASKLGLNSVRPGPMHALYFLGSGDACVELLNYANDAGFIVSGDDPRSAIAVCPGSPACASAFTPVRELAEFAASECAELLDGSFTLHLSGCGKGCAHPSPALLAFSGTADGLAFGYSARVSATPDSLLPFTDQKAALSRLARLYEKEHKPGENARALLSRLGKARIVAALRQDET